MSTGIMNLMEQKILLISFMFCYGNIYEVMTVLLGELFQGEVFSCAKSHNIEYDETDELIDCLVYNTPKDAKWMSLPRISMNVEVAKCVHDNLFKVYDITCIEGTDMEYIRNRMCHDWDIEPNIRPDKILDILSNDRRWIPFHDIRIRCEVEYFINKLSSTSYGEKIISNIISLYKLERLLPYYATHYRSYDGCNIKDEFITYISQFVQISS